MKILLTTLHAKYVHSSLALPYLAAVCNNIDGAEMAIREFTVNEHSDHVLQRIVAEKADIVAFSCYIWNIEQTLELASDMKKVLPTTRVILGGPEVSYNLYEILCENKAVDCIIRGEGEEIFHQLVIRSKQSGNFEDALKSVHSGIAFRSGTDIIVTPVGEPIHDLDSIPSPFSAELVDMEKPLVYYETSRGCPFSCAFCMSSLGEGVRSFSMERIRQDLRRLMNHNTATIKLVDRTFNYDANRANEIWDFIIRNNHSTRFHFEIAADLLSEENIRLLEKAPDGLFRFEIGVQSGKAGTLAKVGRKTNLDRLFANVEQLVTRTGVVIHLDLIAGLPHEDFNGFLSSLQRLFDVRPHHIQVEPLKVLKGSPMENIAMQEGYAFSDYPPYKILGTPHLSFQEINRIEIISRLLDMFFNSGKFRTILEAVTKSETLSRFFHSMALYVEEQGISASISQRGNFELIWSYIKRHCAEEAQGSLNDALCYDFCYCEYPIAGSLPDFFGTEGEVGRNGGTWLTRSEIMQSLGIARGSKVRTFMRRFVNDYTSSPWKKKETDIVFVYISAPGKGLHVKAMPITKKAAILN